MAVFTVYIGFITNYKKLLLAVLGLYLGLNAYAYVLGSGTAPRFSIHPEY